MKEEFNLNSKSVEDVLKDHKHLMNKMSDIEVALYSKKHADIIKAAFKDRLTETGNEDLYGEVSLPQVFQVTSEELSSATCLAVNEKESEAYIEKFPDAEIVVIHAHRNGRKLIAEFYLEHRASETHLENKVRVV